MISGKDLRLPVNVWRLPPVDALGKCQHKIERSWNQPYAAVVAAAVAVAAVAVAAASTVAVTVKVTVVAKGGKN